MKEQFPKLKIHFFGIDNQKKSSIYSIIYGNTNFGFIIIKVLFPPQH
jgi:hypothetical protein